MTIFKLRAVEKKKHQIYVLRQESNLTTVGLLAVIEPCRDTISWLVSTYNFHLPVVKDR